MHRPVLIVGGGPSGLAATRSLVARGFEVLGVERHTDVGGIWDIDNPGSPMYESAHLISSRSLSNLDGLPLPDDYPDYPSHRQMLAYLQRYADEFDLRRHYRFSTEVTHLTPDGEGWVAELSNGDSVAVSAAVLAVGNQWHPNLPEYPGEWNGESFHSREYRSSEQFAGKRVLIVGAGNSGCDIACDAAVAADVAAISMRRGYRFAPKYILGQPADVFASKVPMPGPVQQQVLTRVLDLLVGDVTRFGLPQPDHAALASHPIVNTAILDHLGHGDLDARPDVAELRGDKVAFVDGTVEAYDVIVWATGYRPRFPMVPDGVIDWHGWNPNLFLNVFHRDRDDLFVMGMIETDASAWPHISLQAELIASWLGCWQDGGEQADAFRRLRQHHLDLEGGVKHIESPRHSYYQRNSTYLALAREILRQLEEGSVTGAPPKVGVEGAIDRSVRAVTGVFGSMARRT